MGNDSLNKVEIEAKIKRDPYKNYDNKERERNLINKIEKREDNVYKSLLGFVLFFIIFVFFIPNFLYDNGFGWLLISYLPNVDLLATVLSWWGGPLNIWSDLYTLDDDTNIRWWSSSGINYLALLGLTYNVAKKVYDTNDLHMGWSFAFIMCLMTYLLPSPFIRWTMRKIFNFTKSQSISVIAGFICCFIIIISESFILDNYNTELAKMSKMLISLPQIF